MNAPSKDITDYLATSAVGVGTFGTDLFFSTMPDSANTNEGLCVGVFDTGGDAPEAGYTYERPHLQVQVRGNKGEYIEAYDKAADVRDALHGLTNETINSARYVGIWCLSDVAFISYDEKHRPLFTVNFRIHRTDT